MEPKENPIADEEQERANKVSKDLGTMFSRIATDEADEQDEEIFVTGTITPTKI